MNWAVTCFVYAFFFTDLHKYGNEVGLVMVTSL